MPSTYEFWLLDDAGRRIMLLDGYSYFAYSRSLLGYGTLLIGFPYDLLASRLSPIFAPDRRVDIWRSPEDGIPMRREAVYLLRMQKIYTRETDSMRMVAFTGRDPTDLLSRRVVIQAAGTSYTRKTATIDNMMKAIVREQMLWGSALDEDGAVDYTRAFPEDFTVQADVSLGPSVSAAFADREVREVIKELKDASFQLNRDNTANRRIYFDIVPYDLVQEVIYILDEETGDPILDEEDSGLLDERSSEQESRSVGFQFQTFADLRGQDRSQAIDFSVENNNLEAPYYSQSFLEEVNAVIVKGFGRGDSREVVKVEDSDRVNASRWNRRESFKDGSQEPDQAKLADIGYPALYDGRPAEEISAVFLNVPEGPDTPRSMYGLDWDLGDLVPVSYAGRQFNAEISIVYVAIDENGKETITGRNEVSAESG